MPSRLLACGLLVHLSLAGCSRSDPESIAAVQQTMLDANPSGPEDNAVVKVCTQTSSSLQTCTGAMVAPNLVLTARHCLADFVDLPCTCDANGDFVSGPGGPTGPVVAPGKITIRKGPQPSNKAVDAIALRVFALQTSTVCRNDIALVLLDRSLDDLPIFPIRLDRGTNVGERVRAVGYGLFEDGDAGVNVRHSKDGMLVSRVGSSQFMPTADSIPPRSFEIVGGKLCMGDSGGPAISERGAVIGVFSKFTGACSDPSTFDYFTETGPFSDELIRPAFLAAGAEPLLEAEPATGGAAGAAGAAGTAGAAGSAASAGAAGSDASPAGGSTTTDIGSGGTSGSNPVGAGTASTYIASASGGDTVHSAGSSEVDAGDDFIYDSSPPKGGTCRCRLSNPSHEYDWLWFFPIALAIVRRRIRGSHAHTRRDADNTRA